MPMEIDEEELQRILDQGSAYGPADDAEAFRRTLGPGDFEGDMPKGTRVNIEPEVSVPPRRVIQPRAAVPEAPAEKVVQVPGSPADDFELAAAKQEDRMARSREAFERGTRQLIGGLTQTKVVDSTPGPVDAVAQLYARRKAKDDTSAKAEAGRLGAAKLNYDTKENARKAAEDKARDERDFAYRQKHDTESLAQSKDSADATRALTGASLGIRRDEVETKKGEKADKVAAGAIPLFNGTLQTPPGLSDTERNQARNQAGLWNAADEATDQLQKALEAYVASPGAETAQNITALLGNASTALNTAYGQGAMAEAEARRMADTLGADIRSLGGITALFDKAMGNPDAGKLLLTKIKTARAGNRATALARLRSSGEFSEGAGAAPQAAARPTATSSDGKKVEWDGSAWVPVQ